MATADVDTDCTECPVCSETYDDKTHIPKRLKCPHTICVVCARKLLKNRRIECPMCKKVKNVTDADKLDTDIQTLKFMSAFKCEDCCKYNPDINKCRHCRRRVCEQCSQLHRSADHCEVLTNLREIEQEASEQKLNQALDIKCSVERRIDSSQKLKADLKAALKALEEDIARMHNGRKKLDDFIISREFIERSKSDLNKDTNIQKLKTDSGRVRDLVREWDEIKTSLTGKFNVQKLTNDISEFNIDDVTGGEVKGQGACAGVRTTIDYSNRGQVRRELDRCGYKVASCPTTGRVYIAKYPYVTASTHIVIVDPSQNWTTVGQFDVQVNVHGLAVISDQQIAVTDQNNHCVCIYTTSGDLIRQFGSDGDGDDEFNIPQDLVHHNGRLYISDYLNGRICVWTVEGEFCYHFTHKLLQYPDSLAVNNDGDIIVTNNDQILVFSNEGHHKTTITRAGQNDLPSSPRTCVDKHNYLLVAGIDNSYDEKVVVDVFDASLTRQTRIQTHFLQQDDFSRLSDMCVTVTGDIVVLLYHRDSEQIIIL